jgi:hypothetical protein
MPKAFGARLELMERDVKKRAEVTPEGYVVQEMMSVGGLELILGCHQYPLGMISVAWPGRRECGAYSGCSDPASAIRYSGRPTI